MASSTGRLPLWVFWVASTVVSVLCAIFCLVSFIDMAQIQYDVNAGRPGATINGAMAGTLMSAIMLALLCIVSFLILVRKTWSQSGTGFSYGFVDAAYLFLGCFTLLTGIVLTSAKPLTNEWEARAGSLWTPSDTNSFIATYMLCFINSGTSLATFLALILYQRAVQNKELTMDDVEARLRSRSTQLSNIAEPPAAPLGGSPTSRGLPTSRSAGAAGGGSGAWSLA